MVMLEEDLDKKALAGTGNIAPGSSARVWLVKTVSLEVLKPDALYAPIILDPTIARHGTRLRVANLEDND
jgi:hypothetical protein